MFLALDFETDYTCTILVHYVLQCIFDCKFDDRLYRRLMICFGDRIDVILTSCAHKIFNKSVPNNYISHLKISPLTTYVFEMLRIREVTPFRMVGRSKSYY